MAVSHIKSDTIANWTGTVTVSDSQGSSSTVAATDLVRPTDWNSVHNEFFTLTGNTTLSSTASGTNVVYAASGPSMSIGGSSNTVIFSSPPWISSYSNMQMYANATVGSVPDGASVSMAQPFMLPEPGSFSFIRIPVALSSGSTTVATAAQSATGFAQLASTWNAVVYSVGTGANSRSLQSVASGSVGWTFQNSVSATSNSYTLTQNFSYAVEGNNTNSSTSGSAAGTTNLSFGITNFTANFSGTRYFDINFTNSLSAGPYWLVVGYSTQTSGSGTNSTQFSAATNANMKYSCAVINQNVTIPFGIMGSTNMSSNGGGGSFSTAGGGTTASLPMSAISSMISNCMLPFQMLRSA